MTRIRIRRAARQDLLEHATWLASRSRAVALRFLAAAENSMAALSLHPGRGHPRKFRHPLLSGVRTHPVKGFEAVLVFHLTRGGVVDVLRVLHEARDLAGIFEEEEEEEAVEGEGE